MTILALVYHRCTRGQLLLAADEQRPTTIIRVAVGHDRDRWPFRDTDRVSVIDGVS